MEYAEKLAALERQQNKTYWGDRIIAEICYAARLSATREDKYQREIGHVMDVLLDSVAEDGVITDEAAKFAEKLLSPLSEAAKSLSMLCIAHAHIDMNWEWGFQETASVTVDTFRTMLDLMKEYPGFTFAQSQASTYKIIEEYAPWMLDEIRTRVAEGRWEVTASTWVEPDKNMPSGESLARHILNTKKYLSELLNIDPASLNIDFEPDTFGHSANVPEICAAGGIRYYYHCRGHEEDCIYRWRAPSGAELLVFLEPTWYNDTIRPRMADIVPDFCARYNVDCVPQVYGVGDHGGGPTRRDVERILDMATWPVMPEIRFGTFGEFFRRIDIPTNDYAVSEEEQNFLFTGCYTSQSEIKASNRIAEDRINEAEMLGAMARVAGGDDMAPSFTKAWEKILFNHFHDILPGSGVVDTRRYALGQFQQGMAAITTNANHAMHTLADQIDTSSIPMDDDRESVSEGGGVGFNTDRRSHYGLPVAGRGRGKTRIFTAFNTTGFPWKGPVTLTLWDWPGDQGRMRVSRAGGEEIPAQILGRGTHYWGHNYLQVAVDAEISALGYATFVLDERPQTLGFHWDLPYERRDRYTDGPLVLENDKIRAVFERSSMKCVSLTDAETGKAVIGAPSCYFRFLDEDTVHGMTAWRVGNIMRAVDINGTEPVRVESVQTGGLVQSIAYKVKCRDTVLNVTVRLAAHSPVLDFDVTADFHELGSRETTPQLSFAVPFGYRAEKFLNDIPMGILERDPVDHDVPCRSFSLAENTVRGELQPSVMVMTDTKYGFRNNPEQVDVALLRASTDPDPYPEFGVHHFRIGVALVAEPSNDTCARLTAAFCHPCPAVSVGSHEGTLPFTGALCRVEGEGVCISAVKSAEDGNGWIIRFYNSLPKETDARISFRVRPKAAFECDICENNRGPLMFSGKLLEFRLPPCGLRTVRILPANAND